MDLKLSDFRVNYTDIHEKNMELITNPQKGKYKHDFIGREKIMKTSVQFNIVLSNCKKIPPGIRVMWDFGDGIISNETLVTFQKSHDYSKRGKYNFLATFSDGSDEHNETGTVYIGIAQTFSVSPLNVTVGGQVCFSVSVHADILSRINWCNFYADVFLKSTTSTSYCHIFTSRRIYMPSVYVRLTNGIDEVLYSTTQLAVDYDISGGRLALVSASNPVHLPPGSNALTIQVQSSSYTIADVTCNVTSGDKVNKTLFTFDHDFRSVSSWSITYRHYSLGAMTATARCFNSISEFTTEHQFEVVNKCFRVDERFDRQYSMPDTPLEVSVTEDILLYARSVMICDESASFSWTIEIANNQSQHIEFDNVADPFTNVLLIPRYSLAVGLYKVTSFVIASTWVDEYTFVKFVLPPPTAFIQGGNNVLAKDKKNTKIELDAQNSYQQEIGDGETLTHSWTCARYRKHLSWHSFLFLIISHEVLLYLSPLK